MSKTAEDNFIVTREYRRFAEFCDACRRYRYIGLCCGPPGVGKTLSARHYTDSEPLEALMPLWQAPLHAIEALQGKSTVLYTPAVRNTPGQVLQQITTQRQTLRDLSWEPVRREQQIILERARRQDVQRRRDHAEWRLQHGWKERPPEKPFRTEPTLAQIEYACMEKQRQILDPTSLIIVDEADRLGMASLEQMCSIFDCGGMGLVLLGIPGLKKRLARYPQFYSRVGFVHEFRALPTEEVRLLLQQHWKPAEISCPLNGITEEEVVGAIVRITGGNFRLEGEQNAMISRIGKVVIVLALKDRIRDSRRKRLARSARFRPTMFTERALNCLDHGSLPR